MSHKIFQYITRQDDSRAGRVFYWLTAVGLYLGGALGWGKFLNWGRGPFAFHDWVDITLPRLLFLGNAARQGLFPLHILDGFALGGITDRYLSVPDVYLSPQYILLGWMDAGAFILANFLWMYTVGCAGLLWLARLKRLSPLALVPLVMLFNFNGHMLAHVAIGHYTWTAMFLLPWLIGLVVRLLEGAGGWKWVLQVTVVLLVMLLQGGYHPFIWSLFLLALLIPMRPRQFSTLARALVFAVLVNAARLLPPVLNLGRFDNRFTAGYVFIASIWTALTAVYVPNDFTNNVGLTSNVGTWEYTLYIGLAGALFVLGFGVVSALRHRQENGSLAVLLFPALGLAALSLNTVYQYLRLGLPLPIFTGERVASRIVFLAFALVLVIAAVEFQRWLERQDNQPGVALSCALVAVMIASDLWQNFHLWRVPATAERFTPTSLSPEYWTAVSRFDPLYTNVLILGLVVSLIALTILIWMAIKAKHRASSPPPPTG